MTGFQAPNYTQVPNDFFEMAATMGEAELKVVLCLIRETFGYHRESCELSIRELARKAGLTPRNAFTGASKAIARGLIEKTVSLTNTTKWRAVVGGDTVVMSQRIRTVSPGVSKPPVKESKENKRKEIEEPRALDFSNMTVKDARQLPTLKMYADATEFFPGSVIWEFVHTFISDHKLTSEKIREAAISWTLAGYKRENVKGVLEWALNGIPEKHRTNIVKNEPEQPYTNRWQPELEVATMQPGESYYTADGVEHIYGG